MKKVFLAPLIVALFTIPASAQKVSYGLHAGVSLAKYKVTISGISISADNKAGFTAGGIVDIPMGKNFSFRTGLDFVQAGGILQSEGDGSSKLTTTLNYIEVPATFIYNAPTKTGKVFLGVGPMFDYGVSGTFKDETGKSDVHFGNNEADDLKPFNLGVNFMAGYEFAKGFFVSANYDLGVSNLSPVSDVTYKGHYFGFRIGYFLGR